MTGFEFFYNVALPIGIVVVGWIAAMLHMRSIRKNTPAPGE